MNHETLLPKVQRLSIESLILAIAAHGILIGGLWVGVSWQPKPEQAVSAEVWDIEVREAAPLAAGDLSMESGRPDAGPKPMNDINTKNAQVDHLKTVDKPQERSFPSEKSVIQDRSNITLSQNKKRNEKSVLPATSSVNQKRLQSLLSAEAGRLVGGRGYGSGRGAGLGGGIAKGYGGGGSASGLTGTGGAGTSAYATGPGKTDGAYIRRVAAKIKSNTVYNVSSISGNPAVIYDVSLYPDGSVRNVNKRKSSGVAGFDEAVRQAIYRSIPYPKDSSGRVPSSFVLTHRPKG